MCFSVIFPICGCKEGGKKKLFLAYHTHSVGLIELVPHVMHLVLQSLQRLDLSGFSCAMNSPPSEVPHQL